MERRPNKISDKSIQEHVYDDILCVLINKLLGV